MKAANTNARIKQAQKDNEREILKRIKAANRRGDGYHPVLMNIPWYNALDRLRAAGKVVYRNSQGGERSGYWIAG